MMYIFVILIAILTYAVFVLWLERKIAAFIQDRLGPMEVGKYGLLQSFADLLKLIQKEDIIPNTADKFLFKYAPVLIFVAVFAGYATIPFAPNVIAAPISLGLFYLITIISLDVIGLMMAGWGSGSKFPMFGAMRGIAQIISYEIPLTLSMLCVVMTAQSFDLMEISFQQGIFATEANYLFGIKKLGIETTQIGGFLTWNIFRSPLLLFAFIVFFIAALAECNRAPFDIPEAESELVSGFHTEYSGFRFAIIFLGEYAMMLLLCMLAVVLFLGGFNTLLPNIGSLKFAYWTSGEIGQWSASIWGIFWLMTKTILLLFLQILVRWTYPRLRVDQLMYLCWKVLIPFTLVLMIGVSVWRLAMI